MIVMNKKCRICEMSKDRNEFYKVKSNKDGLHSYCKQCTIEKSSSYQRENKEWRKEYDKKLYSEKKEYYKNNTKQWNINNEERKREYYREWQVDNKDKLIKYRQEREQNKTHEIKNKEWIKCKEYFNNSCAYCGLHEDNHYIMYAGEFKKTNLHKEHVNHDGVNDLSNCVPSCKSCNSKKHKFKLDEWYNIGNEIYSDERYKNIIQWLEKDYKYYMEEN